MSGRARRLAKRRCGACRDRGPRDDRASGDAVRRGVADGSARLLAAPTHPVAAQAFLDRNAPALDPVREGASERARRLSTAAAGI
ncbi:hypothetical protein MMR14E_16925 [Methylobacterium mesophilicum]